ncbi:MAG: HAMP domain-containing protein, partial [Acidobacteriota bacterium]
MFFLAYGLFSSQMEQWFKAPRVEMMENSRLLAERYYEEAEQRGEYSAAIIAGYVQASELLDPKRESTLKLKLLEFCHQYSIDNVRIFDRNFEVVADAGNTVAAEVHQQSVDQLIQLAMNGQAGFRVARLYPEEPYPEISWATASILDPQEGIIGAVLTETINPKSAGYWAGEVIRAYEQYLQLQQTRDTLLYNTFLILGLSTLLIVFAFSWFALYLAKRITVPIQALAQGAAAVAAGNLDYRVHCPAFDELDSLITSFNRMTDDLQENQKRIALTQQSLRHTNVELDDRRRYIETILQTIATGVISLDSEHRIRTMNRAAIGMLHLENFSGKAKLEDVIQAPASDILRGLLVKSTVLGQVVKNIQLEFPGKCLQVASIVTPLADSEGQPAGWVVVLDDMTELLRMEKLSAWQEVARRLAHEIKNPLTPIQLSAERVLRRYTQMGVPPRDISGSWQDEFRKFDRILEECIQTIIQEAGSLKGLVDEFSRFSRLPEVRLEESDLHAILDATLGLYNGRIRDVRVEKDYDPEIPRLQLDTEQMKRVFINLFDNALEAMAGNTAGKILRLHTRLDSKWNSVSIEISDSG